MMVALRKPGRPPKRKRADLRLFNADTMRVRFVEVYWPGEETQRKAAQQIRFVLASRRRYQLFLGGRGAGKSWCLALKALWLAFCNPGVEGAILGRTRKEADGRVFKELLRHLARWKEATGVDLVKSESKVAGILTLTNGAQIHRQGYDDVNSLRGLSLGWAVSDEVDWGQNAAVDVFDSIKELVREPCAFPCLALGTSPDGVHGIGGLFASRAAANDNEARHYFVVRANAAANPHIDQDYLERLEQGSSKRRWLQEGKGEVLTSSDSVFPELDLGLVHNDDLHRDDSAVGPFKGGHRIPWEWRRDLPYIIGIDWGTSAAAAVFIQVQDDGLWVVADELRQVEGSYQQFREMLSRKVRAIGYLPAVIAADKAVGSENTWAKKHFGPQVWVGTLDGSDEQEIALGLEAIRYMIDPYRGRRRLLFAASLPYDPHETRPGIVGSMMAYGYRRGRNGVLTNIPSDSPTDPYKHFVDALRYAVMVTRGNRKYHGGTALPFTHSRDRLDLAKHYEQGPILGVP